MPAAALPTKDSAYENSFSRVHAFRNIGNIGIGFTVIEPCSY